jgi:hypothetical protein
MIVGDRYRLVWLGRFCRSVNCTGILVSINQPLRICVKAIDRRASNHSARICRGWFMLAMYVQVIIISKQNPPNPQITSMWRTIVVDRYRLVGWGRFCRSVNCLWKELALLIPTAMLSVKTADYFEVRNVGCQTAHCFKCCPHLDLADFSPASIDL